MRRVEIYEVEGERKASTLALTLLRVGVGCLLIAHGWMKLVDIPQITSAFAALDVPNPRLAVYLAILAEFFGGIGLVLGALTPLAALGPVLSMGCAIYFAHRHNGPFAEHGGWEYPLTLLLVALFFVAHGAGPISVDALVASARRRGLRHHRHVDSRPSFP
ncbi:MAG TPA: DoxX family protein [Polyangiaceae bacterium]|jgi:putative oxidoreductase|nr:DoxX family protein [Polyangiaceae bacterium]